MSDAAGRHSAQEHRPSKGVCPAGPSQGPSRDVRGAASPDGHARGHHDGPLARSCSRFPGKLRLKREQYLAVQTIYYPGFTIAGIAEPAVVLATLALLITTPAGTAKFWLVAGALAALITVQAIFWIRTPAGERLLAQETELNRPATRFFETRPGGGPRNWMVARDQWERSHILRALAAALGLLLLTVATVL